MSVTEKIKSFFKIQENNTSIKTEIIAGITTFLTMSYIIIVNPLILSDASIPYSGVLFATCLVSAVMSIAMGIYSNNPWAMAPGMGLNAYVTYTLILGEGISWQSAFGAIFIAGFILVILSITKVRDGILKAIPKNLRVGLAAGIGLFITFIGFQYGGIVEYNPATLVSFSGLNPNFIIFMLGLILTAFLYIKKIKGAFIIGIIGTSIITFIVSIIAISTGIISEPLISAPSQIFALPSFETFFKFDLLGAFNLALILPTFTLMFTDLFDSVSTFVGVAEVGNFYDENGNPRNFNKALLIDSMTTMVSGMFGTSDATVYIESAAGIEQGGRTGLTAVVIGLLFIPFMFFSPLLSFVPAIATSPVLVLIGVMMIKPLLKLDWDNYEEVIPAFISAITIPFTYSITEGIVFGFIVYVLLQIIMGKIKEITPWLWGTFGFSILALIIPIL